MVGNLTNQNRQKQMKTITLQRAFYALVNLSLLLIAGCGDQQAAPDRTTQNAAPKDDSALKDLETKTGLLFPSDAVLVSSGDGGGRDASYGYYEWAVFSPAPIKLPAMQAPPGKEYLDLPLESTAAFVQSRMGKLGVEQAQSARGSHWKTNEFGFRATLIRSPKGDYLVIQRGKTG